MSEEISYWLQISSGKGPDECAYFVGELAEIILKEAKKANIKGLLNKSRILNRSQSSEFRVQKR